AAPDPSSSPPGASTKLLLELSGCSGTIDGKREADEADRYRSDAAGQGGRRSGIPGAGGPLPGAPAAVLRLAARGPVAGGRLRPGDVPATLALPAALRADREVLHLPLSDRQALLAEPAEEV